MRTFPDYATLNAALALEPLAHGAFRFAKQFGPAQFICHRCGQPKPLSTGGSCSTGYGVTTAHMVERGHVLRADEMVCFECAGDTDRLDMIADGKGVLYLTHPPIKDRSYPFADGTVSNWPGTLKLTGRVKKGHHNIAGSRYDVWFTGPDGKPWHGVQYGENSQIARCRRINKA